MKTQRVADLITDILYSAGVRRIYAPALCRRAEAQLNVTQEGGPWKSGGLSLAEASKRATMERLKAVAKQQGRNVCARGCVGVQN